jgi:positive regulator of sigma E activity
MFKLIREDSGVGIVCAVSNGQVFVAPLLPQALAALAHAAPKKSCAPKAGCGSCGGCAFQGDASANKFRVCVENSEKFKIGDRVAFNRFVPEPAVISTLVFGLPVAAALTAMFFWLLNTPEKAESPVAAITIAAAFFGGFAILGVLDKLFRKKYPATLAADRGERTL